MKTTPASDHVYFNDGFKCSSISINTNLTEQNGGSVGSQGSSEFILTSDGKKIIPPHSKMDCAKSWLKRCTERTFNKKTLHKRLPITRWLPKYSSDDAVGDLVAGVTVGLTVIPQALAYAGIAGVPAAYGLYGSFLGCFVYIFLGSCKDVPFGPSAIVALLTFQAAQGSWQKSVLLCLLCGIVELLMGIFGLGFLIDFVSGPVSSGFTSAVSLIIVTSQIKDILGIAVKGTTFLELWSQIIENVQNTQASDTILGLTCIVILLMMRLLSSFKIGSIEPELRSKSQNIMNKIFWIVGTSRNAILVIVCGAMGYIIHNIHEGTPFRVIGYIPPGLPTFELPPTSLSANETLSGYEESFIDIVRSMGSGLIVVPLISLMENIAICKAFANGKPVDASQELIAIGVANIANSFVQGFPGTGALSRGAVNHASGVRTSLSNVYSGALVILALLFFTPYFYYIPKATLAAIIIAAVVFMVEVKVIKPMWRAKKSDLVPGIGTFLACLILPLEIGILIGIGLNVIFILYHAARPKISTEILSTQAGNEYLMITPDRCLIFPSVDYVRNLVNKQSKRVENVPVVIDASHIYGADFTAATVIESLLKDFASREQLLFFYNLKPSICTLFESLSPTEFEVYYQEDQLDELLKSRNYVQKKVVTV
ncbi:sodium-independent sulfate anion transporter isoform X2 [Teleopsis dalmanni]|uniref:sodium-independent sulfate anion transporter isoform X1 n=1 Tax=Teleopsis dalmanni TaxID=139649 RepID=UPI0018CF5127|nr:sodium-independent sulfate anion transporter isoform X1 [Teleopsis dalmanni]XP_037949208.1 sodium-independent sulfate anion transporter isoform X2 [Teleopsis dalmanni]